MIIEAGGPHHCPSPTLQTAVLKSLEIFTSSFFDSPEIGWKWKSSQIPLRCPQGSQCSVRYEKFWSQSQVGRSTNWGPGIQGLSFKTLAQWKLLKARGFVCLFLVEGAGYYIPPSTGRKGTQPLITHSIPKHIHTPQLSPRPPGDRYALATRPLQRPRM